MASGLPNGALQASKAALNAALSESEQGEGQEVDMQAQAENIRTVFNDPTNFNVKVRLCLLLLLYYGLHMTQYSIPCIHPGPSGLILHLQRAETCHKPPYLRSLKPHFLRHLV